MYAVAITREIWLRVFDGFKLDGFKQNVVGGTLCAQQGVLARFTSDRTLIQVTINGEKRELESPMSISELLTYLEIKTRALAVELNHEIQTREAHGTTQVGDGDVLEIVTLVGGG